MGKTPSKLIKIQFFLIKQILMPNALGILSFYNINLLLFKFIQLEVDKGIGNILYRLKSVYKGF